MPVTRLQAIKVKVDAGHFLDRHPVCGRQHGHQYTIMATFAGAPPEDNWGEILTPEKVVTVTAVLAEFSGRNLNDMLPASPATACGFATYLLERLTMHGAVRVEVHESGTDKIGIAEHNSW